MKLLLLVLGTVGAVQLNENPIRRIVNLLQNMQKKIEKEGEEMDDMFEKFLCYCKTNTGKLDASLESLNNEIPQIEATLKEKTELKAQLDSELADHKKDRSEANSAIESATEQRNKDKAAFDADSTEAKTNIAACSKAIGAIEKGLGASFLQTTEAAALDRIVKSSSLSEFDMEQVSAFLQGKAQAGSGEIVGILKQLLENMEGDLAEMEKNEAASIADFEGLVAAKEKAIAAATTAIEDKTERAGKTAVAIVNTKNDLEDAQEAQADDTTYLANLKKNCAEQQKLMDDVKKTRADEIAAIGATIGILNNDDALDLFKKTLPSPGESLLEVNSKGSVVARARALVKSAGSSTQAQAILLALMGKKAGFEKVIKMMDEFIALLGKEQVDDDTQKEYCEKEFDRTEDEEKDLKRKIATLSTTIAETEDAIATLKDQIAALEQGIKDLDSSVAEATATRKDESAEYQSTKAANTAAVQLLEVATNQLNKFYNPKLYKAPPKRELTEEERIYVASGGTLTTPAPGGIAGTGITVFTQLSDSGRAAPPPPPMAVKAYKKKDSSGPIALINRLKNDLELEMKENDMEEKTAQRDYEELMSDSGKKRAADSKTIVEKETQKADAESSLDAAKTSKKGAQGELMALREFISGLHGSCDFLIQNFGLRKDARAGEVDAIKKAKAVLNGANYDAFPQVGKGFLGN